MYNRTEVAHRVRELKAKRRKYVRKIYRLVFAAILCIIAFSLAFILSTLAQAAIFGLE